MPYVNNNVYDMLRLLDQCTMKHSMQVKQYIELVVTYFDNDFEDNGEDLITAGLFHDIGKIYIPRNILDKPGALNPLERQIINLHSWIGYNILKEYPEISEKSRLIALYHHSFTPASIGEPVPKCEGEEIIYKARILHTIDSFEALTSDRPYRKSNYTHEAAVEIMRNDPMCVEKILGLLKDIANAA